MIFIIDLLKLIVLGVACIIYVGLLTLEYRRKTEKGEER